MAFDMFGSVPRVPSVRLQGEETLMTKLICPAVERVFDCHTAIGESPLWDSTSGRLYWVDIPAGEVFFGDPASGRYEVRKASATAGSLGLHGSDRLLVAAGDEIQSWPREPSREGGNKVDVLAVMPERPVRSRFNDGKVGPDGRFWVGTMDPADDRGATGAIYGFGGSDAEATGVPILLAQQLVVPNGIAWSPDGRRMIYSDSGQGLVWSLPFDVEAGPIVPPVLWGDWSAPEMGMPDGAAMDEEGCYWSCGIFASAIHRFVASGEFIASYHLPVSQPTMCCFGGSDRKTLFVTSMTAGLNANELAQQPLAGSILAFRVEVAGAPIGRFG
jgi:sugar lactone lactonase YvrE